MYSSSRATELGPQVDLIVARAVPDSRLVDHFHTADFARPDGLIVVDEKYGDLCRIDYLVDLNLSDLRSFGVNLWLLLSRIRCASSARMTSILFGSAPELLKNRICPCYASLEFSKGFR